VLLPLSTFFLHDVTISYMCSKSVGAGHMSPLLSKVFRAVLDVLCSNPLLSNYDYDIIMCVLPSQRPNLTPYCADLSTRSRGVARHVCGLLLAPLRRCKQRLDLGAIPLSIWKYHINRSYVSWV
jgi:hypothetical protein